MVSKEVRRLAVKALKKTRAMLNRPFGWTKGTSLHPNLNKDYPAFCLMAAMQNTTWAVTKDDYTAHKSVRAFIDAEIHKKAREVGFNGGVDFNDAQATKKKDVIAFLDELIVDLS